MQFNLSDYRSALERSGRKVKKVSKGLLTQCLAHQERNPSAQVFEDGWIQCYSCSTRYHISHYFPELKEQDYQPKRDIMPTPVPVLPSTPDPPAQQFDLYEEWSTLPEIPEDHVFKTIPISVLNGLGWRLLDNEVPGMGRGYFIPYFDATRTRVPFAQTRHLVGERRFSMLAGAQPTLYGKWNVQKGEKLFLVEGCSDAAVLEYAMVPWIAVPSASSTALVEKFSNWCYKNGVELVFAGDNDVAGKKVEEAIGGILPYRVCQPPKQYKDWGEFLEAEGVDAVYKHCEPELFPAKVDHLAGVAMALFNSDNK